MRVLPLPDAWRERAILITEVEDEERWFSVEELRIANEFPSAKRRSEWILSRIASKELALRLGIVRDATRCTPGRPRLLIDGEASPWFVSLSHSVGYAAAALDRKPVGIDVEKPRHLRESASHLFLTAHEEASMRQCAIDARLIHFWAAKEAIYKQHQGEFQTLKRVPLHLVGASPRGLLFEGVETAGVEVIAALTLPIS